MLRESSFSEKWPVVPLGDVVDFLDNLRKPVTASDRVEGEYLYYGANGVQGTINNYIFDEPLVLLAEDGGHFGNPDRDIAYIASGKYWVNNHAHVLKPKKNYDLNFLYRVLQRYDVTAYIKGATRAKLTKGDALNIKMPLPPFEEQKRIAAILDKADAIRRKRQQAIKLADDFLRSVFLEMFGDPVTNPKGFEIKCLSEFYIDPKIGTKCGPFGSALKKEEFKESGVPVWNMDNISLDGQFIDSPSLWVSEEKFSEIDTYSVIQGDVIISRAGTVGKMGVVRSKHFRSLISTNLIRVRFGELLLPEYFVSLMAFCKGRVGRLKTGPDGSFTHMNTGVLDTLEFPYPPIQLQNEFLSVVNKVEKIKSRLLESLTFIEENAISVSNKAFSGKL